MHRYSAVELNITSQNDIIIDGFFLIILQLSCKQLLTILFETIFISQTAWPFKMTTEGKECEQEKG